MKRIILAFVVVSWCATATLADISCKPGTKLAQQNRTEMKHRTPPTGSSNPQVMTVALMAAESPAAGVSTAGFKTSEQPIDPRENLVFTLKGDIWEIKVEANDCDFHLEISDAGGTKESDRVIIEIPQGPKFVAARNALIKQLKKLGIKLHKDTKLKQPIRVQVLGYAFYDAWHYTASDPQRGHNHGSKLVASIWEIHPVWAIIFPSS